MKKPKWYRELPKFWQEAVDQAAHFSIGFAIGLLSPILSIVVAIVYEVIQNWGDENNDYVDMAIDLTFWSVGAVLASLVF